MSYSYVQLLSCPHDAKTAMESRDGWTYHVIGARPQRVLLGHVIDEHGHEVTELRPTDDVSYCA